MDVQQISEVSFDLTKKFQQHILLEQFMYLINKNLEPKRKLRLSNSS